MNYRIDPSRRLPPEISRIAREQIDEAIAILDEGRTKGDGGAHEARKRFKRLRGLLRLIAEAAPGFRRREEHRIKEIAASLSAIRDATAIIETIDRFADEAKTPDDIDRLMTLRRGLQARRDRIVTKHGDLHGVIGKAIAQLRQCAASFDHLHLPDETGRAAQLLAEGVERTHRRACAALRKARKKGRDEDFHELRKSVKYHEMHLHLLRDAGPESLNDRWRQAERLGDSLGDLHDIPVLAETLKSEKIGDKHERKFARAIMRQKRKELSAKCLEKAESLFAMAPEELACSIAIHYAMRQVGSTTQGAAENERSAEQPSIGPAPGRDQA